MNRKRLFLSRAFEVVANNHYLYLKDLPNLQSHKDDYLSSYESYINYLKSIFPQVDFFINIRAILRAASGFVLDDLPRELALEGMINYVLNFGESDKENKYNVFLSLEDIESDYFICDDSYFEFLWDDYLKYGRTNRYGDNIKEMMWDEIESEVSAAIEMYDEDDEDSMNTFEDIEKERMYFLSYWHYPLDNLDWTKDQLCDWYNYNVGVNGIINYLSSKNLIIESGEIRGENIFLIPSKFFYQP